MYTTDREFVEEYSRCMAVILGREENRIMLRKDGRWRVKYGSAALLKQQTLETLKLYIEHNRKCIKAFLRAFFDGEGSNDGERILAYNANRKILVHIKQLLKRIGVRAGKISVSVKAGTEHKIKEWRDNKS